MKKRYRPFLAFGLLAFVVYYFLPMRLPTRRSRPGLVATRLAALTLAAFFVVERPYAGASEAASGNTVEQKLKSRSAERDAFNKSARLGREGDAEKALEIQRSLTTAKDARVAARANYNVGAANLQQIIAEAKDANIDDDLTDPSPNLPDASREAAQDDRVKEYETARTNRKAAQTDSIQRLNDAARSFGNAVGAASTQQRAIDAIDAARAWGNERCKEWDRAEFDEREKILAKPEDRLRWLESETRKTIDVVRKDDANAMDYYRRLFDESRAVKKLIADVNSVGTTISATLGNEMNDAEGAKIIDSAQKSFHDQITNAADAFGRYDVESGVAKTLEAQLALGLMRDVVSPYEQILMQRLENERLLS
ncbi:MAG: hypothetical protein HUK22_04740, partial [Thermoguttaceae bacterium]|nr:hypothetical protein [Thermoguttaceae bacterium]